jgi:hypothetical protein
MDNDCDFLHDIEVVVKARDSTLASRSKTLREPLPSQRMKALRLFKQQNKKDMENILLRRQDQINGHCANPNCYLLRLKTDPRTRLKKCARCKSALYCSVCNLLLSLLLSISLFLAA